MGLRFKILGRTALRFGDRSDFDDQWGHSRLRGMVGALLLQGTRGLPVAELIEWVWPDGKEPGDPVGTLYSYAWRVRQVLRQMDPSPNLVSVDGTYRIEVDQREVDLFSFLAVVEKARVAGDGNDHEQASQELADALALWSHRPLADLHGERAANWRLWAETELWLPAQDLLLQELSASGRYDQVLHRIAELPTAHQASLPLVKRKLEALYGRRRYRDAKSYLLRMRKQLLNNGDHDEADDLLRFNDILERSPTGAHSVPAATVDTPHLLRRDIQDFTGREDLLGRLDEVTGTPGVLVLDGEPGVGKTALAVHWAHRAASRYPGGVLYADLGGFSHGPRVEVTETVDEFLAALGFPAERIATTAGRQAKLRDLLAGRRVLALLDNAFDSAHVEPLLDCLSACQVVVTSRRRLSGLARRGATNVTVPPLSYQECRSWLARRLDRRLAGAPDAADLLAAMCGGNILLALRVVVQHVATARTFRSVSWSTNCGTRTRCSGLGDDGDGPDSSVRAALSLSYRALDASHRRAFRLLGLHPGPDISVDVAAVLTGQDRKQTERELGILVNAHLLTRESRNRFRFHDLLRKYAAERAAGAERLLSYFLHTAYNADSVIFPFRPGVNLLPLAPGVVPTEFPSGETWRPLVAMPPGRWISTGDREIGQELVGSATSWPGSTTSREMPRAPSGTRAWRWTSVGPPATPRVRPSLMTRWRACSTHRPVTTTPRTSGHSR